MTQLRALIDLPAEPGSVAHARTAVRGVLEAWQKGAVVDDAVLVVSELVTNAVLHAPGTDSLELEIVDLADGVRVQLADGSAVRPVIRELASGPDLSSEHGRGLVIVQALARRWGSEEHQGGKRVWVEIGPAEEDPA